MLKQKNRKSGDGAAETRSDGFTPKKMQRPEIEELTDTISDVLTRLEDEPVQKRRGGCGCWD